MREQIILFLLDHFKKWVNQQSKAELGKRLIEQYEVYLNQKDDEGIEEEVKEEHGIIIKIKKGSYEV